MIKKVASLALITAIVFQFAVLCAQYLNAAMPLWRGTEVRIATVPYDPRSLFRGNYARLRYDISRIEMPEALKDTPIRTNEPVFVQLKKGENGLYEYDNVVLARPDKGHYLRGRVQNHSRSNGSLSVKYGIEAFFAPKEKALALEKDLTNGGVAVLMVMDNGKAALKDVVPNKQTDDAQ
ncbi:MAG: GDYXXLXY domain-containing protein [Pseudomonadota bacterium]